MTEIVFVTSNFEKLTHARFLCRDYDVNISKQKNYGKAYVEPRIPDRIELFEKSVNDAYIRWCKNVSNPDKKFFFIEDTSVNIPALSLNGHEYPGVDIKYWMKENNFSSVNAKLKESGNDRTAIVRSDIILVLPQNLRTEGGKIYKIFTSSVKGTIIDKEIPIKSQPYFSWLNNKTFNKWFVPDGCTEPLSKLPIEVANKYDFRRGAFNEMLQFLEEKKIIRKKNQKSIIFKQHSLGLTSPLFIVCGPTCAGKTTIADYLMKTHDYYHIEASDFMHVSFFEHHGLNSSIKIADFASIALKIEPCIVSDQIIKHISKLSSALPIIITGFRSIKEIECFKRNCLSPLIDWIKL